MENKLLAANAAVLEREFLWLEEVLAYRFQHYFQQREASQYFPKPPVLDANGSRYEQIIMHYPMTPAERLCLLLALAPSVKPQALDLFFTKNKLYDRGFTEFGGHNGQSHSGFLPTGETVIFVLTGGQLNERFRLEELFSEEHYFFKHNILRLETTKAKEPLLSGALLLSDEYRTYLTTGRIYQPRFSAHFPAQRIQTALDWKDAVLAPYIMDELQELKTWIEHQHTIRNEWALGDRIKPGYRALFHGPPGTGKTMTACLLAKSTGLEVYRIDLSQVVSKYIGETEKNLARIFTLAENKQWILFFDEADALFGKRTSTKDAHDRYANQEIAYLLQRIEDFPGVVILATNLKGNIDQAFARRFQSMVYFPIPNANQRLEIWQKTFRPPLQVDPAVDFQKIARDHELAGGAIVNVLRYCSLAAVNRDPAVVQLKDVINGIRRELRKEGKTV